MQRVDKREGVGERNLGASTGSSTHDTVGRLRSPCGLTAAYQASSCRSSERAVCQEILGHEAPGHGRIVREDVVSAREDGGKEDDGVEEAIKRQIWDEIPRGVVIHSGPERKMGFRFRRAAQILLQVRYRSREALGDEETRAWCDLGDGQGVSLCIALTAMRPVYSHKEMMVWKATKALEAALHD